MANNYHKGCPDCYGLGCPQCEIELSDEELEQIKDDHENEIFEQKTDNKIWN